MSRVTTQPEQRRLQRTLRRGAMLLLLGLLISVAVAWTSALFLPFGSTMERSRQMGISDREWWLTSRKSTFAGVRYHSTVMVRALQYEVRDDLGQMPAWVELPQPVATGTFSNDHYEIADARGWPFMCLSSRFSAVSAPKAKQVTGDVLGGIAVGEFEESIWYDPRVLPLTPIWWGLIANTLFYALLCGTVWYGGGAVRRAWRRRRHRCVHCGYVLSGTAHDRCPECGNTVRSRLARWLLAIRNLPARLPRPAAAT